MFNSLKSRTRAVLLALAILPILGIGLLITARIYNVQVQQVIQLQQAISENISLSVINFTQARVNELKVATQVTNVQELSSDEQNSLLLELLSSNPAFDLVALLDATGQELARVSRTDILTANDLINRADDEAFTVPAEQQEDYYGGAFVDEATSQLVATISYPIINSRTGNVTNVIVADIRLGFLAPLLDTSTTSSNTYVLNDAGRVIAHPNSSVVLRETLYELPDEAGVHDGLFGESVVLAYTRIGLYNTSVYVVSEQDTTVALSLVTGTQLVLGIGLLVNVILSAIFATLATRFVVRPLEKLAQVAQKIERGDLSQRAQVTSNDEIGVLARTFNSMTDQLSALINNLEQRVSQRTRDLTVAAEVSQQVTRLMDLEQLLPNLANLTKEGFSLYHASVFVFDADTNTLRLAAGSGETGRKMLEAGKQFNREDKGLVPLSARSYEPQIINDVRESVDYAENSFLPDTRSEVALPMRIGTQLIGVLDLQSTEVGHFSTDDLKVLTSLAEQIAVAIRNAQLFNDAHQAREEAEKANSVKSMFLASMSHELRTPLNSIINFTKFVSRGVMGEVNPRQVDTLANVINSGQHLLALINDVLDISKIESGSLSLFMEDHISLPALIESARTTGESLLVEKSVDLIVEVAPDLPTITCDKQRMLQILLNVVSNACKFTKEGHVKIKATHDDSHVMFAIEDTGPGIALEDYNAVFETFKQTQTGLRQGGGTGLGMPITKSLVEAHHGQIWIESRVGEGTTFYLKIPISQPNTSKPEQREKADVTA